MQVYLGNYPDYPHYPDEPSGAVCTCLHLSCLADGVLETKRHKTLIPLMGDFGHLLGHAVMLLLLYYTPALSTYASLCDKMCRLARFAQVMRKVCVEVVAKQGAASRM